MAARQNALAGRQAASTGGRSGWLGRIKDKIRNFTRWLMAWLSMSGAIPSGFLLAATFVGGWISDIAHYVGVVLNFFVGMVTDGHDITNWFTTSLWALLGIRMAFDLAADLEPNRWAVYGMIVWPSLSLDAGGKLGAQIAEWANLLNAKIEGFLGVWIGQGSALIAATIFIGATLFAAHKVLVMTPMTSDESPVRTVGGR